MTINNRGTVGEIDYTKKKNTSTLYFFRLFIRNKFSLFANQKHYFLSRIFLFLFYSVYIEPRVTNAPVNKIISKS